MMQNVWWNIFPYLGIPIHLNLHVVLGTDPHPDPSKPEELIFTYQEDHSMSCTHLCDVACMRV